MSITQITYIIVIVCSIHLSRAAITSGNGIVVFQSDFGLNDQTVSAMHGVALGVDKNLKVEDFYLHYPCLQYLGGSISIGCSGLFLAC